MWGGGRTSTAKELHVYEDTIMLKIKCKSASLHFDTLKPHEQNKYTSLVC